ncbi:MAG: GEVED domain-containing protein [Cyanobacteria bacterium J06560_5]
MLLATGTISGALPQRVIAQVNPSYPSFDQRYNAEIPGNLEAIGNASVICDRNNATCADGLANGTVGNNNAGLAMQMLDIDSDGSTFNSSSAQLNIPVGANVRFAALYWGGSLAGFGTTAAPNISAFNQISLQTPTSGAYQTITADSQNDRTDFGSWRTYGAFADITTLVQGAGNGNYTVANVQSNTGAGFTYPNAGWSIVVVYEDPAQPVRNISIFDGHDVVRNSLKTFNLTGLRTPPTPGFDVFMGAIANDGETDQAGDFLHINNNDITDALNPANNFFNGTISKFGSHVTSRTPNDRNNMVIDIDYLDLTSWNQANNAIPTNATSIDLTLESQGDGIWPLAYFFAVQVFEPNLVAQFEKTTPQASYANGDTISYTISVTNTGNDNATDTVITDAIPTGTTFVPGSLKIGGVAKTDGAGDDEAEFDGSNVIFRVGTAANATQGGQININDTATMTFDVTVTAAPGDLVCNQATIDYEGQTSGNAASGNSDDPNTPTFGDCTEVTTTAPAIKDYGDAPDSAPNTGTGNYQTLSSDSGPSHALDNATYLGAGVSLDSDAFGDGNDTGGDASDDTNDDGVQLGGTNLQGQSLTAGETVSLDITTAGSGVLNAWIDWNGDGDFTGPNEQVAMDADVSGGVLSVSVPTGATVGDTYARFRYSSDTGLTPTGAASDGEVEDYAVVIAQPILTSPNLALVKRITAINGDRTQNPNDNTALNTPINDGIANSPDDEPNWPANYLLGEINAGIVKPGDDIEYTVYFLNTGESAAEDVRICDWIQANQGVVTGLYGGNDIELQLGEGAGSTTYNLTLVNDVGDRAQLATVDTLPAGPTCNLPVAAAGTTDEVVVIDLTGTTGDPADLTTTLPGSTGSGTPDNAFGLFRFTTKVNE